MWKNSSVNEQLKGDDECCGLCLIAEALEPLKPRRQRR